MSSCFLRSCDPSKGELRRSRLPASRLVAWSCLRGDAATYTVLVRDFRLRGDVESERSESEGLYERWLLCPGSESMSSHSSSFRASIITAPHIWVEASLATRLFSSCHDGICLPVLKKRRPGWSRPLSVSFFKPMVVGYTRTSTTKAQQWHGFNVVEISALH
jgi:hypothetical protein